MNTEDMQIFQNYVENVSLNLQRSTNLRLNRKLNTLQNIEQKERIVFNDDYCVNLSKTQIPQEVQHFLGLGLNFAIPVNNIKQNELFDLITNTDFLLKSNVIPEQHKDTLKALVTNDYINYFKRNPQMSPEQKLINQLYHQTIKFLKDHREFYIINSDKGQKTVIIDKIDYENKMKQHLSDANTK